MLYLSLHKINMSSWRAHTCGASVYGGLYSGRYCNMKQIGGFFTYEPLPEVENHFLESLCPPEGDLGYFMSGRCANYYAL